MEKIVGFNEAFGKDLEKKDYMMAVMRHVATKYNYSEINVPIIEDSRAYSEEFVGNSPWPEWNEKGCFFFEITNYTDNYINENKQSVVLIPEGTVSVTRWLANQIEKKNNVSFPIKLFYSLNCYRNELLSSLSETKKREFKQFGLEILGTSSPQSDAEIICLIGKMLSELGVPIKQLRVRLNDIRIFEKLINESQISIAHVVELKSLLDSIAEAKVGKNADTLNGNLCNVYDILHRYNLNPNTLECWKSVIEHKDYSLSGFFGLFDDSYNQYFELLLEYKREIEKTGMKVDIDPCVIRSHEYYTGISFEIDVVTQAKSYLEIAGGGRYDRLVGKFLQKNDNQAIPCTGFAFGTERVFALMNDLGCFNSDINFVRSYSFSSNANKIELEDASISEYVRAFENAKNFPIDISFGGNE